MRTKLIAGVTGLVLIGLAVQVSAAGSRPSKPLSLEPVTERTRTCGDSTATVICDRVERTLVVRGSAGSDHIEIKDALGREEVACNVNTVRVYAPTVCPEAESLTVNGFQGDDRIDLSYLTASYNTIEIYGGVGNDKIKGTDQNDLIQGGPGNDHIWGRDGDDVIDCDPASGAARGSAGHDRIDGGRGLDRICGGGGNDHLFSGPSFPSGTPCTERYIPIYMRDQFGRPTETIQGGGGNDCIDANLATATVVIEGGDGDDQIKGIGFLDGGAGNDVINVHASVAYDADYCTVADVDSYHMSVVHGRAGDDRISGSNYYISEVILAEEGDDAVFVGQGVGEYEGGSGTDHLIRWAADVYREFGWINDERDLARILARCGDRPPFGTASQFEHDVVLAGLIYDRDDFEREYFVICPYPYVAGESPQVCGTQWGLCTESYYYANQCDAPQW